MSMARLVGEHERSSREYHGPPPSNLLQRLTFMGGLLAGLQTFREVFRVLPGRADGVRFDVG